MIILLPRVLPSLCAEAWRAYRRRRDDALAAEAIAGLDAHMLRDIGASDALIAPAVTRELDYARFAAGYPEHVPATEHAALAASTAAVRSWLRRSRSRAELAGMDEHDLHDLALSGAHAAHEASKPFWRS